MTKRLRILFASGNPPDRAGMDYHPVTYLMRAAKRIGHDAIYYDASYSDTDHDVVIVVSSDPLLRMSEAYMEKPFGIWFIDNRLPWYRAVCDNEALRVLARGGWVFCAQTSDMYRLELLGSGPHSRLRHMPLGYDPEEYRPDDSQTRVYDMAFVGAVYDDGRARLIRTMQEHFDMYVPEPRTRVGAEAARVYNKTRLVFNPASFFGASFCYDTNMRAFEVLGCGAAMLASAAPDMSALGIVSRRNCLLFRLEEEAVAVARNALSDDLMLDRLRQNARAWRDAHTYDRRLAAMLDMMLGR